MLSLSLILRRQLGGLVEQPSREEGGSRSTGQFGTNEHRHVFGWTTPSVTDVEVIGASTEDYAVNVNFDEPDEGFWFADDLLEFIDHGPEQVMSLDGIDLECVRLANGEWEQRAKGK